MKSNRRTFAIISHPDAGKTTLTERLLLYAGAIQTAGMVKGKAHQKAATSDWMEIEKQRGISVTSTVLQFPYQDHIFNLLDTPGHGDFSEDTYRTLMAADSAIMLIDAAKGVEPRTRDLFEVCSLRKLPIFTFINKMDRTGLEPLELIDNIEKELGIVCHPVVWPLGSGPDFKSVYRFSNNTLYEFSGTDKSVRCQMTSRPAQDGDFNEKIQEDLDFVHDMSPPLENSDFMTGQITPVMFGSALTGYGLDVLLQYFSELAPQPRPRSSSKGEISPEDDKFSGLVFKIQANTDPKHRDRMAFIRICSGRLQPGDKYFHVRLKKVLKATTPQQLFARERQKIDEAVAGDVIGLHDPGIFQVGDTLTAGEDFIFDGIPLFSPEHFAKLTLKDPLRRKQLNKGLSDLAEEGAIQVFIDPRVGHQDPYIGAVGKLQFDVLMFRLLNEYGCQATLQTLPFHMARWLISEKTIDENYVKYREGCKMVEDLAGRKVLLFRDDWELTWATKENPDIQFIDTIQRAAWAERR